MTSPAEKQRSPWIILIALCLGFFMILLDTTIVNIAIPSMVDGLDASLDQILWVINAYVLVYAVLLITAGRLGDRWGPKTLFLSGMVLFTLASVACGLSDSPSQLIAARVVQAVGGAMLTPQTLSIITRIFPAERRGAAFGIWGAVAGVAAVAGPTLGGFIVSNWGWEWIFFVNVPVGIASFALAAVVLPNLRHDIKHRLDIPGTVLITAALLCITFALIEGEKYDWGPGILALGGVGIVLLIIFLVVQYYEKQEPLVPFDLLRNRNFSLMNFVAAAISFGMLGLFLPFVIYLQSVLGLSALAAGLTLAPAPLISMFIAPFAGRLADRIGGKFILFIGLVLFASGMAYMVLSAHTDSGRWAFLPGLIILGAGMGCSFPPMTTMAMRTVEPRLAGAASGVLNTTRQMGAVIGSAAVGALLQAQLSNQLPRAAKDNAGSLPSQFQRPFVDAFSKSSGGLEIGRGQTGAVLPDGLPPQAAEQLQAAAERTFHEGFTAAMRPTMVLPIAVLAAAALLCLAIRGRSMSPAPEPTPVDVAR